MRRSILSLVIFCTIAVISSCGGGGGSTTVTPAPQPTMATIKLSLQGTPSTGNPIAGAQATITLPAGVTVKATQNAPQTDTGVVSASGSAAGADLVMGTYATASNTVTVYVFKAAGFSIGEIATVACNIATGSHPQTTDFSVSSLVVSDTLGNTAVTGLSPAISVTIQ